jgi:hypothetical protein
MVNAKPLRGTYDSELSGEEEKQYEEEEEQGTTVEQPISQPKFYGRQKKIISSKTPGKSPLRKFNPIQPDSLKSDISNTALSDL